MNASLSAEKELARAYEQYADLVYRVAFLLLKNKDEAEDVLQNVFIKRMRCGGEFACGEHEKAWLIVTAKNAARDVLKSYWRRKTIGMEAASGMQFLSEQPEESGVFCAVMGLKPKYRLPLYLHYYEGYKTEEISKILKVKPSTVRSQLRIARQKLKLAVEEEFCDD
mgnify:CR=1 FL=1